MSKVMTPAEFATEVESDGKTVRKFLRSITPKEDQPGKGSRWSIAADARSLKSLKKQFGEWSQAQLEERAKRAQEKAEAGKTEADPEVELDA